MVAAICRKDAKDDTFGLDRSAVRALIAQHAQLVADLDFRETTGLGVAETGRIERVAVEGGLIGGLHREGARPALDGDGLGGGVDRR